MVAALTRDISQDPDMRYAGTPPSSRPGAAPPKRFTLPASAGAFAALVGSAVASPAAHAADAGGISVTPSAHTQAQNMVVRKITCLKGCASIDEVKAGAVLRFQGPMLTRGRRVVYLGGPGDADDVLAQLRVKKSGGAKLAFASFPKRAHSGPVAIEIKAGARSPASVEQVTLPGETIPIANLTPLSGAGPFFPIRGTFKFGTGTATFGGGRSHEGQDVFAKCGTPLVAAEGGTVMANKFHARAGNYIVVDVDGGVHDAMYAHLKGPALPKLGTQIAAGTPLGEVGDTGRADGCHLHFELWNGNWQGVGGAGTPVDPLPTLRQWAAGPGVLAAR